MHCSRLAVPALTLVCAMLIACIRLLVSAFVDLMCLIWRRFLLVCLRLRDAVVEVSVGALVCVVCTPMPFYPLYVTLNYR